MEESAEAELVALRAVVGKSIHDLSNALGAVLNYSTFLAEDLAGAPEALEYLPHLEQAARRALGLVGSLNDELIASTPKN
jgi:signal transduction histidine kinase